jgi:outer membrane protein OmpA-like peptidoglycan-associated protein
VFAVPDGKTIYFSSMGHSTMGGFDVFKAVYDYDLGKWGEPENVGYPINSADNDVGLVMSANGLHGYISAYHEDAIGQEDLYRLTFPEAKIEALTILKGHVYDAKTKQAVHAAINILDLEEHKVIATFESNEETGHYLVSLPAGKNYAIEIEANNYLFHSENFNLPKTDGYHEEKKDIYLNTIEIGSKIILNNIFFDFDKATLRSQSIDELNVLLHFLTQNSTIKVEISGHTDNKGSDTYNQKLSENRAHVVVDWLIEKGISKERMVYKGYGEKYPIGTNDTDAGRQHNRRTELKIIGK